jgi:glycosyltransferase involved in cell wall biosynthesis
MRIVQVSAGTGSFHCGNCMRDNTLVTALRKRGHDAILLPLYLDMVLDEPPQTRGAPLLFGGINVYLQHKLSLFRKTPRWIDKLFDSPAVLRAAAKGAGMTTAKDLAEVTISSFQGEDGPQVKELDRLADWLKAEPPDVVSLSTALMLGMTRRIKERTGARVVCTMQGEEAFMDSFPEPYRTRAWDLLSERARDADALIAPTRYYADLMIRRARLDRERVHVVPNGIALDGYSAAPAAPDPPVLGYLARMIPGKGLGTVVEAFILMRQRGRIPDLKLRIAGSRTNTDEPFVRKMEARLEEAGLRGEVEFLPNVSREEKIEFLRSLSVFSVPATYGESFGLYLIEALAAGVPVVQPRSGAFPELVEATGGGVICEPNDPAALAEAIESLLLEPERARALGEAGRRAVAERYSVDRMTEGALQVFEAALRGRRPVAAG